MSKLNNRATTGIGLVVLSTGFAGLGGYLITVLMAASLGSDYSQFAVFWSCLYVIVGTMSGAQQEASRGVRSIVPIEGNNPGVRLVPFALSASLFSAIFVSLVIVILRMGITAEGDSDVYWPLIFAGASSILLAFTMGGLYGMHAWRQLAGLIILDVAFRLIFLEVALQFTQELGVLAWACVLPIAISVLAVMPFAKRHINFGTRLDERALLAAHKLSQAVLAALGTALLVNGFPAIVAFTNYAEPQSVLSPLIFAIVLTRAPLVVGTLALQSLLIVSFRDGHMSTFSRLKLGLIVILVSGLVFASVAYAWGDALIALFAGQEFRVDPTWLFWVTISSVSTGWLALTGAMVLAANKHLYYSAGWITAAIVSSLILMTPIEIGPKIVLSLIIGPLTGLCIHLASAFSSAPKLRV